MGDITEALSLDIEHLDRGIALAVKQEPQPGLDRFASETTAAGGEAVQGTGFREFSCYKKLIVFAGLDPSVQQSGKYVEVSKYLKGVTGISEGSFIFWLPA